LGRRRKARRIGSGLYYLLGDGEGLSSGFVMLLVGSYAAIGFTDQVGKAGARIMSNYKNNK